MSWARISRIAVCTTRSDQPRPKLHQTTNAANRGIKVYTNNATTSLNQRLQNLSTTVLRVRRSPEPKLLVPATHVRKKGARQESHTTTERDPLHDAELEASTPDEVTSSCCANLNGPGCGICVRHWKEIPSPPRRDASYAQTAN